MDGFTVKKTSRGGVSAERSSPALEVGQAAPDFSLPDEEGRPVRLSEFRGKKVVLYFYPKDDTPGCTREACDFRDERPDFNDRRAVILGVSADSGESHKKFKAKYALNFPLLSDPERRVIQAYGAWKQKSMYGRTYMGIVRSTVIIDEKGRIERVFPKVSVTGHAREILNSLR